MKRAPSSVDGFIPRRPHSQLGELHAVKRPEQQVKPVDRSLHTGDDGSVMNAPVGQARTEKLIGRSDIDESLSQLNDQDDQNGLKGFKKRRITDAPTGKPKRKIRRIIKWIVIVLLLSALGAGIYMGIKVLNASDSVFQGNFLAVFQNKPLKEDENGRSNFLIIGTSEDDPGHEGANLTDSLMVVSVDQTNKNAYMISIPRDLYVDYGRICPAGYRGKINTFYSCVNDGQDAAAEQDRQQQTRALIGELLGIDIQYSVHVNYTVVRDVINAIGGSITLTIESRDPRGILDSNFDWKCGATFAIRKQVCPPNGHFIQYPNGEVTLDAEHALYLAQARGDIAPTYGLEQSNFDREKNQQKVLVATKDKAVSAGTLTNIGKVTALIDALGHNLRTNIDTSEIRTLMDLGVAIKSADIKSISLIDAEPPLLTTGDVGGGSSVFPTAGLYVYSDIQAYIAKNLSSDPVVREGASISVLNGSGVAGVAQTVANELIGKNYTVDEVGNAPDGTYEAIEIYQLNKDNAGTAKALAALYGVKLKTTTPPVSATGETDFIIIVGKDPAAASASN